MNRREKMGFIWVRTEKTQSLLERKEEKMENRIIKFLAYDKKVSIMCADLTKLVEEIRKIHDLTPTVTAAAGRVATVAAMMAHLEIKEETDSITIQIKGTGPIGNIVAIVNLENKKMANIKMYVGNPHVELPLKPNGKIDVGGAVGHQGYLNVIKENEVTNSNYNGLIPLVSGEIAEDFTEFFAKSEQKPTALALGVLVNKDGVKRAGGYIINPMPDATSCAACSGDPCRSIFFRRHQGRSYQ